VGFFSRKAPEPSPVFIVNGNEIQPEAFGLEIAVACWDSARQDFAACFGADSQSGSLGISRAFTKKAMHAALELQMLKVGAVVWHLRDRIQVGEDAITRVMDGVKANLLEFVAPNGAKAIPLDLADWLIQQSRHYAKAVAEDAAMYRSLQPGEPRAALLSTTRLAINSLCLVSGANEETAQGWKEEIEITPEGFWLRSLLDLATDPILKGLTEGSKVTFRS
jgi:hypothetical protein